MPLRKARKGILFSMQLGRIAFCARYPPRHLSLQPAFLAGLKLLQDLKPCPHHFGGIGETTCRQLLLDRFFILLVETSLTVMVLFPLKTPV